MIDFEEVVRIRIAIGPLNTASQASSWAKDLRATGSAQAESFAQSGFWAQRLSKNPRVSNPDMAIPHWRLSPLPYRRRRIAHQLRGVTHLLNESNAAVFGNMKTTTFEEEHDRLLQMDIRSAIVFHGSDIRDPSDHMARYTSSYFHNLPDDLISTLSRNGRVNRGAGERLGIPTFVTTPDLLHDLPEATWLRLSVEANYWSSEKTIMRSSDVPIVLHLPSNPLIKGTRYIEPVLAELERRRLIRWLRAPATPHSMVRGLVHDADIVIDQIQSGSYGVAALEALAAGRVVVGNVSNFVREIVGESIPIVDANPADFQHVLTDLIEDHERLKCLARSGPAYVERWHSSKATAEALGGWITDENAE